MAKQFVNKQPFNHMRSQYGYRWAIFIVAMLSTLLLIGCGEKKPRKYRVGILNGFKPFSEIADGFKVKMTELGYLEGQHIIYDQQRVEVGSAEEKRILEKFVTDEVDLIFAFPTGSAIAAKAASQGTNIPVVFAMANLEGINLIENLRQPGLNITGVRTPGPEIVLKRLEFLLEVMPQAKRIYTTYNKNYPANQPTLEVLRPVASSLGVTLVEAPVTSVGGIKADLEARTASDDIGLDAILILSDDLSQSPAGWPLISQFAQKHKVPVSGGITVMIRTGAVISYVPDYIETGKLAAISADKILRGTAAGTIPVTTAVMALRINYKQAQELGLSVPKSLLSLATEIIH
jgi:putative ABC transport system substrate-binding protein